MKFHQIKEGVGRIVKGVNTTPDVGPNQTSIEAGKFGNKVDKDGRPPTLSKKVKGSKTNVLFNLGMTEGYKLNLERDKEMLVLNIKDTQTGKRTEVRGKLGYESGNYDPKDKLHRLLDKLGKSVDISQLINGEPVGINPKHPHGDKAKIATDKAYNENSKDKPLIKPRDPNAQTMQDLRKSGAMGAHKDKKKLAKQGYQKHKKGLDEDKEVAQPSEIFVDMDGVLADFFGSWKKLVGKDWRKIDDIDSALQKIRDTENFWLDIPPTKNANNLLGIIKKIKGSYNILSAPLPNDPNSEPHKREWIKNHLKGFPPNRVIITHDKAKYATQPDGTPNILIDDYGVNVQKWESAGGVGFKHKDHKFERTARNLAAHLKQPAKETYTRQELPQITKKDLKNIYHTTETVKIQDLVPVQKERLKENFSKQLEKIQKGNFSPIVVDCENKIINGHHRYDILKMLKMEEITVCKLPLYLENLCIKLQENEDQHPNEKPLGPETKPAMPAGSIRVKVSDVYDWYKLGTHISDLGHLDHNDFGEGPPQAIISFGSEEEEHKYIELLKKLGLEIIDIDPGPPDAPGVKGSKTYSNESIKEDGKDEFSKNVNPMGSDSVAMAKLKKSPGFYDMIVTFYSSAVQDDRDDEEVLPIMSSMLNMNVEEIKAVLRQYGKFTFGGESPEDKFKTNMSATGFLGKKDKEKDPQLNSMYSENFADGKVKGKSRPGRVKKSGASCNGSVTDLRKRAKNASGEKAKMYHWCANMKSGKGK